jgi:hypothetical protein
MEKSMAVGIKDIAEKTANCKSTYEMVKPALYLDSALSEKT